MTFYTWNEPTPRLCFGRDELLDKMLQGLAGSTRHSFGVAGGRRIGKTTLLRRIELELYQQFEQWKRLGKAIIPIYFDCAVLPRPVLYNDVWHRLLREVQRHLTERFDTISITIPEQVDYSVFITVLQPVLQAMPEKPRIVFLFDEIEPIIMTDWSHAFLAQWRSLLNNVPGVTEYFSAAFAGAQEMTHLQHDIGSPIRNILRWFNLRALDFEASTQLLCACGIEWPQEFLSQAFEESGGHPMLIQYVMQHVMTQPPGRAQQSLSEAIKMYNSEQRWQLKEWWIRYCTPEAQRVYKRMPDDKAYIDRKVLAEEFGMDPANEALEMLLHVGLIRMHESEDQESFCYAGEMFRRWYQKYGVLTDAPIHDLDIYALLLTIDKRLADKYIGAWQHCQVEVPNYLAALSEIHGVLDEILDFLVLTNGFQFTENNGNAETLRSGDRQQRFAYITQKLDLGNSSQVLLSDYSLLEISCEQLVAFDNQLQHNGMSNDLSLRRQRVKNTLMQWDSIFSQLLSKRV